MGVRGGHGSGSIRRTQALRGGRWQYGEGGGGGTERAVAVGRRGWADSEGGRHMPHVSVGGQHIRVGGTYHGVQMGSVGPRWGGLKPVGGIGVA